MRILKSVKDFFVCKDFRLRRFIKHLTSVMPDSIRHPERLENTGFRFKDCRNDTQTSGLYGQNLFSLYSILAFTFKWKAFYFKIA